MASDKDVLWTRSPTPEERADTADASEQNVGQSDGRKSLASNKRPSVEDTVNVDSVELYERERQRRVDANTPTTDDNESFLTDGEISRSLDSISNFSRNLNENYQDKGFSQKLPLSAGLKQLNDQLYKADGPGGRPPAYFELVAKENTLFGDGFKMTSGMRDDDSLSRWPGDNQFYAQVQRGNLPSTITASTFDKSVLRPRRRSPSPTHEIDTLVLPPATPKPPPPPPKPPEEEDVPIGELLTDYTQNTTLHGLRFFTMQEGHMCRKVFWIVIILAAWAVFLYYSASRIGYYLEYNKNVNVEVNYEDSIPFPAVTICNQNSFRITALAEHDWYNVLRPLFAPPPPDTSEVELRECTEHEFRCDSDGSYKCVDSSLRCDMFPDCESGQDEKDCEPCPYLLVPEIENAGWAEFLPDVVGFLFIRQDFTYIPERPLYVRENNSAEVYFYYHADRWWIGGLYDSDLVDPMGYSTGRDIDPSQVTKVWKVRTKDNGTESGIMFIDCIPSLEVAADETSTVDMSLVSRETLYQEASTIKTNFIEKCTWKGEPCENHVRETPTNMGNCYSFNADPNNVQDIEVAGPGNGLIMVINTEFYEYTKNADDGVGIKLSIHQPGDVAQVKERGVSVSPGLYSFVSVETTQVTNLKPPWGSCMEKELRYYGDPYSMAKCAMERETNYTVAECQCRDFYQPGNDPICDVQTYIDCVAPALVELSGDPNAPPCFTPCSEKNYVPTTSFAVVLGSDNTDDMSQKTADLKQRLFNARETAQRVVEEKKMATHRIFFIVEDSLAQMTRFLQATIGNMEAEYRKMMGVASLLTEDCMWLRDVIAKLRHDLQTHLMAPFLRYQRDYAHAVIFPFQRFVSVIDKTLSEWPRGGGDTPAEQEENRAHQLNHISERNLTIWQLYRQVESAANTTKNKLKPAVERDVTDVGDTTILHFNTTMLIQLFPYFSDYCPECMTLDGESLVSVLKEKILTFLDTTVQPINGLLTDLDDIYKDCLLDLEAFKDSDDDQDQYNEKATRRIRLLNEFYAEFVEAVADGESVLRFLEEFEWYVWRFQCRSQTAVYLSDYTNGHEQMAQELHMYKQEWDEQIETWTDLKRKYWAKETSLQAVGEDFTPTNLITELTQNSTRLDTVTYRRQQDALKLQHHIASVNYLLLAVTSPDILSTTSVFWKYFRARNLVIFYPHETQSLWGNRLAKLDYNISVGSAEAIFWSSIQRNLERLKVNKEKQVAFVISQLQEAGTFFYEYEQGNELTANFYSHNYLTVEVFPDDVISRRVVQQVAYSFDSLISECGGLMGLLMGASVISIFELIDMVLYYWVARCAAYYHVYKNKKKKQVHPEEDTIAHPDKPDLTNGTIWATDA